MTEEDAYNAGYNLGLNVGAKKKVEELKDKINKKIIQINDCLGEFSYTKKYKQIQEEKIVLLKEILELLK